MAEDKGASDSAQDVFEPLVRAGEAELQRALPDLIVSGLIAGMDIGFGPLAMGVVAGQLHNTFHLGLKQALFFGSFFYPLGFIFVILGKSELFTENTLKPVAGLLAGEGSLGKLARRWGIVLTCNTVGGIAFSLLASHVDVVFSPYRMVYREMGLPLVSQPFLQAALAAVLGGWIVALMAWIIEGTSGDGVHLLIIYLSTYLLTGLLLFHSVIGSIEVLLAMFAGAPISWAEWLTSFMIPTVIGNVMGGVVLVTASKGVQARSEK